MIQRKQSIWLLLASICSFLTIQFSFYSGNIINHATQVKEFAFLTAKQPSTLIFILTLVVGITSLGVIFLYKNRNKQLLVCSSLLFSSITNLILYYLQTKKFTDGTYSLSAIVASLIPVFILLAISGIYNDEKLIKSADRLR